MKKKAKNIHRTKTPPRLWLVILSLYNIIILFYLCPWPFYIKVMHASVDWCPLLWWCTVLTATLKNRFQKFHFEFTIPLLSISFHSTPHQSRLFLLKSPRTCDGMTNEWPTTLLTRRQIAGPWILTITFTVHWTGGRWSMSSFVGLYY